MTEIRTCLWFASGAEEAAEFYVSLLPASRIDAVHRSAPGAPPVLIDLTLAGAPYTLLQAGGGPEHTHAASIAVQLDTQEQADELYGALLARGGSEVQCGWVTDVWGVSWQVIPAGMYDALFSPDGDANQRAFAKMQEMKRLNLAAVNAARTTG